MERIGGFLRFVAACIDGLAQGLIVTTYFMLFPAPIPLSQLESSSLLEMSKLLGALGAYLTIPIVLTITYNLCDVFLAATPGKLLVRIHIRNENGKAAGTPSWPFALLSNTALRS
jgi:hypothetical protein